jgi:antitoxin (DNA-binding transcriptional repressor) of toxin-antitoxin stability system
MDSFTIPEAKEKLEDLIARAARGEDVRIVDPVRGEVRLMALVGDGIPATTLPTEDRVPGRWAGRIQVPARLMEPMSEEELRDWYGDDQ